MSDNNAGLSGAEMLGILVGSSILINANNKNIQNSMRQIEEHDATLLKEVEKRPIDWQKTISKKIGTQVGYALMAGGLCAMALATHVLAPNAMGSIMSIAQPPLQASQVEVAKIGMFLGVLTNGVYAGLSILDARSHNKELKENGMEINGADNKSFFKDGVKAGGVVGAISLATTALAAGALGLMSGGATGVVVAVGTLAVAIGGATVWSYFKRAGFASAHHEHVIDNEGNATSALALLRKGASQDPENKGGSLPPPIEPSKSVQMEFVPENIGKRLQAHREAKVARDNEQPLGPEVRAPKL